MRLRIALYSEGAAEDAGEFTLLPQPGRVLTDSYLGPAHLLVRRCILPSLSQADELEFASPLNDANGMRIRGSKLLLKKQLRQLLTWVRHELEPDLSVILVDQDGDNNRLQELSTYVADIAHHHVIGCAIPEFESWLLADHECAQTVVGRPLQSPPHLETMAPGSVKDLLNRWLAAAESLHPVDRSGIAARTRSRELRSRLAATCDLAKLRQLRSFESFLKDCARAIELIRRTAAS